MMQTIAQRIKARREELGMSAEELGEKIGKAKTTIYRYESGYIEKVPTTVLEDIASALNVSAAYLMGWAEHDESILRQLTDKEIALVFAYRKNPSMQDAVDRLLGIN